jgi:uncharacterized protein YrrD
MKIFAARRLDMFRTRDFTMMDVINVKGKKIGFIKDIMIDFHKGRITGFIISPYSLVVRSTSVMREDIICFDRSMIVRKTSDNFSMSLKEFNGMDVLNSSGDNIGVFEDVIFDSSFIIRGAIISSGIISKLFRGKKIVLINELVVGEKNLLYSGSHSRINFTSVPHKFIGVE